MNRFDAERLTDRIQLRLATIAENTETVIAMIETAKASNAHEALGYQSWPEYVADKFSGRLAQLEKLERLPLVRLLSEQGMSTRAIAPIVGTSHQTVANDIAQSGVKNLTPEVASTDKPTRKYASAKIEALHDARTSQYFTDAQDEANSIVMASATTDEFEEALAAARADGDLSQGNAVAKITTAKARNEILDRVVGRDGKSYSKSGKRNRQPAPPRYGGNRKKHAAVIESIAVAASGLAIAASEITVLDASVTREEAARLAGDLSTSIGTLVRLRKLLDALDVIADANDDAGGGPC